MYCKNCGANLPDNTDFCPKCGASTADSAQLKRKEYAKKHSSLPLIISSVAAVVLVAACVALGIGNKAQTNSVVSVDNSNSLITSTSDENRHNINDTPTKEQDEEKPLVSNISAPETDGRNETRDFSSAKELVSQMKIGWNLGNSFDVTGVIGVDAETAWGNPKTSEELVNALKKGGFNVFRLPVSWGAHIDENYNIDTEWMNRVQEVVDYAYSNDMFVILNTHHEEWYMPNVENVEGDLEEIRIIWSQIAEHFKDYGEKLIFEGLNEPRLRGEADEWTGTETSRDIVNLYMETFVNTVRATGGNNAKRALMITPYAADTSPQNLEALEIPNGDSNIIVSVHAYLPYSFALDTSGTSVYDENNSEIPALFNNIKRIFVDNGIPVIIGEFGCVNKGNTEEIVKWVTDYLTAAKQIGVPCIWWDNNAYGGGGENFGLINRNSLEWYNKDVLEAMMNAVE